MRFDVLEPPRTYVEVWEGASGNPRRDYPGDLVVRPPRSCSFASWTRTYIGLFFSLGGVSVKGKGQ